MTFLELLLPHDVTSTFCYNYTNLRPVGVHNFGNGETGGVCQTTDEGEIISQTNFKTTSPNNRYLVLFPIIKICRIHSSRPRNILNNVLNFFKRGHRMFGKNTQMKFGHEPSTSPPKVLDALPEVAVAAIASYKKQKEVSDFLSFILGALERNSDWLNVVVGRQANFRCALLVGAGPNRFQLQEIIYPTENDIKLQVEHRDSEDYDKVAVAALLKIPNSEIDYLLKYIKTRLYDNTLLKEDLLKGKALGISFAVLRPFSEKQYRVMERIVIGSSMKCVLPIKKRRRDEKSIARSPVKRSKRVF